MHRSPSTPQRAPARHERPILTVAGLTRNFGDRDILRSFDLTIGTGDRVAVCGPNGSGKTTLLRCIAGTLTPSAGRGQIAEYQTGTLKAPRLTRLSFSQERSFYLRLSGRENLFFFARMRGVGAAEAG